MSARWSPCALAACVAGGILWAPAALGVRVARAELPPEVNAQRIDGIAAVVGGLTAGPRTVVLLRSDVELRARLALAREGGVGAALGALPEPLLAASLRDLLGEALIAVEAARLSLASPAPEAVAEERARLLGSGDAARDCSELVHALGVSDRELGRWAERRAVVRGFLQANLEGTLDVREAELDRQFETEPGPFAGRALADVRARYAAWLAQQRLQRAVERWVQSLMQRTPHRVLADYRDREPDAPAAQDSGASPAR